MTDRDPIPIFSVEERLRVCLTLTKGVHHVLELAGEHERAGLESFAPKDVLRRLPELTRALRDQLLAVRAALPFACLSRDAPLTLLGASPPPIEPATQARSAHSLPPTTLRAHPASRSSRRTPVGNARPARLTAAGKAVRDDAGDGD